MRQSLSSVGWAVACVLMAHAALAADAYREPFDGAPEALFEGQLLIGEADGWAGEVRKGTYFLINRQTPEAKKVIVLPRPVAAPAKIGVSIIGQFEGQNAGAGLAYGYQPDGRYYAFVVMANSAYALYRGGPDGLRQLSKATNKAIQVASVNHLAVELRGSEAVLTVNGERVYGHSAEGDASLQGQSGIIAVDRGAFSFDDFSVAKIDK